MSNIAQELIAAVEHGEVDMRAYTDAQASVKLKTGGWSRKEILGHLVDSAANNHQRFVRLSLGEVPAMPGYEQEGWVRTQGYQEEAWNSIIDLWSSYNRHLAHVIGRMPEGALERQCRVAGGNPVTLKFLVSDYLQHMMHHLEQMRLVSPL
jgi:hypothetical protein